MSDEKDAVEDEVLVQVESDEPSEEPEVLEAKDGMKQLKRQLDAEIARRQEAEKIAFEAQQRAHAAQVDKEDTDIHLVSGAIDTLDRDTELLKQNLQIAMQRGDHANAVALQEEISENKAKLLQLRNGLDAMKARPKAAPPRPVHTDPVEAFAARLTPRSANWVRAHPEYVTDPAKNRKMIAAHELAVADGIPTDTPEYFAAIEETLKIKPQDQMVEQEATSGAAKVVARRDAAPAAAPVSRGQPLRNAVRLSAAEREMAEMMGMKPEEYAKNKLALQKEGKLQ